MEAKIWHTFAITLVRFNLKTVDDFIHALDSHLNKELCRWDVEAKKVSWDKIIEGTGMTEGDLLIERRDETLQTQTLLYYFAIILIWASLDQFLSALWQWSIKNGHISEKLQRSNAKKRNLTFGDYNQLLKELGIDLKMLPYFDKLDKTRNMRNIIAHNGGWHRTPDHPRVSLAMTLDDLRECRQAVFNTCEHIATKYEYYWMEKGSHTGEPEII